MRHFIILGLVSLFAQQSVAQAPKVITDTRYVRGATMAFGRIKSASANNGTMITKKGFCLSENPNPTVDDTVSTKQLSNNGTIYYFEGLKPATRYYMRAYATNKSGDTGYGDVIKFYTVPKGNVTFSLRNSGDAAVQERIRKASETACDYYNNMTNTSRHFNIGYGASTPTADCNYQPEPWMNVGPNQSYQKTGTIMHEMMHGMGLMNYSTQWCQGNLRSGNGRGNWTGDRVTEALTFWENEATMLNGDDVHESSSEMSALTFSCFILFPAFPELQGPLYLKFNIVISSNCWAPPMKLLMLSQMFLFSNIISPSHGKSRASSMRFSPNSS